MRIGYGISVAGSNQRNLVSAQAEQVIWKVAIFGAGTLTSNGEYIWDGTTLENGKPVYINSLNSNSIVGFGDFNNGGLQWGIYDDSAGFATYVKALGDSLNDSWILNTEPDPTANLPAPSSALSYAQDSFISSFELDSAVAETFSRTSGGNTTFTSGTPAIYVTVSGATLSAFNDDILPEIALYVSTDSGFNWSDEQGFPPVPNISAVVYSA